MTGRRVRRRSRPLSAWDVWRWQHRGAFRSNLNARCLVHVGPTWWRGRQLQWFFGLSFSGDLFPVGEIWLKIVWGRDSGNPCVFFLVGMRSSGTSIRKQAGLLIAGRTSLTFIQLRLKTERGTQQNTLGCREQARYPIESHQYHVNLTASIKTFEQISKYPSSSRYTLEN